MTKLGEMALAGKLRHLQAPFAVEVGLVVGLCASLSLCVGVDSSFF